MQLGNLLSGVILGQTLGASYLTATSLSVSVVFFVQLPGLALPVGLSIILSKLFSERRFLEAKKALNATLALGLAITLAFLIAGIFFTPSLAAYLAGGFPEYIPLISDYLSVFFYSSPLLFLAITFPSFLAADNHPGLSALYLIFSTVLHLGLELLFCLYLPKDHLMVFVALSVNISFAVGFVMIIPYLRSKTRLMKFGFSSFSFFFEASSKIQPDAPALQWPSLRHALHSHEDCLQRLQNERGDEYLRHHGQYSGGS